MKLFTYLMLFITATNCGSSQQQEKNPTATQTTSIPEEGQDGVLVGKIEKSDLLQTPHKAWFDPMYKSYKPDEGALKTIKENINEYKILMYMGTWCADSQREVPKFYKLLELSEFDTDNLEVIAVREDKTLPDDGQKKYNIIYVPTIIFMKNGKEVGRFVEYPQEELENDIAKIVSGQDYKHSYE